MKTYTESDLVKILAQRVRYGFTQAQLAEELDVPRTVLCEILKGKRRVTKSLCAGLGFEKVENLYRKARKRKGGVNGY